MISKKLMSFAFLFSLSINTTTYGMQELKLKEHREDFNRLMFTPGIQELLITIDAMALEDQERLVESLKKEYARALGTQNNNDDLATQVQALTISIDREHQEYEGLIKKASDLYTHCFTELLNNPKICRFIAAIKALPETERQKIMQILRSKTMLVIPDLDLEVRAKALTAALSALTKKNDGTIRGHHEREECYGMIISLLIAPLIFCIIHVIQCYAAFDSKGRSELGCGSYFAESAQEKWAIAERSRFYHSAAVGPEYSLVLLCLGLLFGVMA